MSSQIFFLSKALRPALKSKSSESDAFGMAGLLPRETGACAACFFLADLGVGAAEEACLGRGERVGVDEREAASSAKKWLVAFCSVDALDARSKDMMAGSTKDVAGAAAAVESGLLEAGASSLC